MIRRKLPKWSVYLRNRGMLTRGYVIKGSPEIRTLAENVGRWKAARSGMRRKFRKTMLRLAMPEISFAAGHELIKENGLGRNLAVPAENDLLMRLKKGVTGVGSVRRPAKVIKVITD